MRVALVYYDVTRIANEPGNKTVVNHFGHMPNIQLLYVAAVLEGLGVEVTFYDMAGMGLSMDDVDADLLRIRPDLIGLSIFTSHYHNAIQVAEHFKTLLPRTGIMVGGVHMLLFPRETLEYNPCLDFGCVGEAEMVLPEFVRRFKANESFEGLPGLVWRDGDEVRFSGPAEPNQDLDSTPFPARHLVPNEVYFNFISTRRNYTVFNTSRGCPFKCIFCEATGAKWRARSAANVVAEMEECYERFGVREIDIFDSSFTISKPRVLEICRLMVEKGLHRKLIWDVRSRVDTIDEEILEALKEAGCYRIFYGIESANPLILKALRKDVDLERIERIITKTDRIGISAFGYFLVGSPGETPETIRETVDLAKRLPLDFAIFNNLTAFPGTELYNDYYLPGVGHDFWSEYLTRDTPPTDFMGRPWTELDNEEVRRLSHRALLEFYLRPGQLYRAVRSVRSPDQFRRYASAGLNMVWGYLRGQGS